MPFKLSGSLYSAPPLLRLRHNLLLGLFWCFLAINKSFSILREVQQPAIVRDFAWSGFIKIHHKE